MKVTTVVFFVKNSQVWNLKIKLNYRIFYHFENILHKKLEENPFSNDQFYWKIKNIF